MMKGSNSESPIRKAWKRLKKNIPAMVSLLFISIAIFTAIFAAVLAPDSTPDANDQVLEISNEAPGFKTQMLLVHKNRKSRNTSWLSSMFIGKDNVYEFVPITSYTFESGQIIAEVYKGKNYKAEKEAFDLINVLYPLPINKNLSLVEGDFIVFNDFDNKMTSVSIKQSQKEIIEKNIVTKTYYLGTDNYGRDILSRLIFGLRVSISVGLIAVLISLFIGITIGSVAGFYRGKTDDVLMWFINVVWSIPTILLAMALSFSLGNVIKSFWVIYIAVGLSMWVEVARIVRGQVMAVRELEFVQAAGSMGFSNFRIIFLHILPNIVGPILVITAANFASAILIEAGLSFVGIGVQPPKPSLGIMLSEYRNYLTVAGKTFLALSPGLAIMFLVLIFNIFGNGLRDAFDVKGK